jgi:hypothetical protein
MEMRIPFGRSAVTVVVCVVVIIISIIIIKRCFRRFRNLGKNYFNRPWRPIRL